MEKRRFSDKDTLWIVCYRHRGDKEWTIVQNKKGVRKFTFAELLEIEEGLLYKSPGTRVQRFRVA